MLPWALFSELVSTPTMRDAPLILAPWATFSQKIVEVLVRLQTLGLL